jgi:mannose-1-phosphate guanylyltransferase
MTDQKQRAPRNTKPLSADAIVKKVRAIYATQARRIAELKSEDEIEASRLISRALDEDENAAARAMLSAVGIVITVIDAEYDDVESAPPEAATTGEPRGVSDYVPGPAARAARAARGGR